MDKKKPIIMLSIAVVIALVVTLLTYMWLKRQISTAEKSMETQPVVVTAVDVPWGTNLTKEMIKTTPFLKSSLPPGYFSDPAEVAGRTLIYPARSGELVLESRLAPVNVRTGGVAAMITPNKRAMAVKVDKVIGVAGFVHPGNRVDVLVTLAETEKRQNPITKIVLENILVIATGSEIEKTGKQEKPEKVDVITLEVTPEEGGRLALAATQGKLQLALRNYVDTQSVKTRGTTIPSLLSSDVLSGSQKTKRKASPVSPGDRYTVEMIKGDTVKYETF